MNLGLENKRNTIILGGALLVLGYVAYVNVFSGSSAPAPPPSALKSAANSASGPAIAIPASSGASPRIQVSRGRSGEFRPVLRSKRVEDRIDPMKVDPMLHLELLAKLQAVAPENSGRNVFQFGPPPPPPAPPKSAKLSMPEPVVTPTPPPPSNLVTPPPPPPPVPLKYYGNSTARANGRKTAFFLDGDEILSAVEGDILKKRYRVVRIGVNSVVVEDTQLKREQPVPLEENANVPG